MTNSNRKFDTDYQKLTKTQENIAELLAMPDSTEIDFTPKKLKGPIYHRKNLLLES